MFFAKIFTFIQGLIALAVGVWASLATDWSALGVSATPAGVIELNAAIGGVWVFLGLWWTVGTFGRRLRSVVGAIAALYAAVAIARSVSIVVNGGAEAFTLAFLAFEVVSVVLAVLLFTRVLNPERRRIFAS